MIEWRKGTMSSFNNNCLYTGFFKGDLRQGAGRMEWPDFCYDGEWHTDAPTSSKHDVVHPAIRKCIQERRCTTTVYEKSWVLLPQKLYSCYFCNSVVCEVCSMNGCHKCDEGVRWNEYWSDNWFCECDEEDCRRQKKQHKTEVVWRQIKNTKKPYLLYKNDQTFA